MAYLISSNSSHSNQTLSRPYITSFDSGYEHSLDHYVDVRLLLQDADDKEDVPATLAAAS